MKTFAMIVISLPAIGFLGTAIYLGIVGSAAWGWFAFIGGFFFLLFAAFADSVIGAKRED